MIFSFFMILIVINVRKVEESQLSVLLRILTNYLQLITVSTSFSSSYPRTLVSLLLPIKRLGGSTNSFLSIDCFFTKYEVTGPFDSNAIFKLFLLMLLPLILFGLIAMIWLIVFLIKRSWVKNMTRNLIISFITIVFLLHPKLTEQSINVFKCIEIDDGVAVAKIDTNIGCYSSTHLKWCFMIAAPILIVWVIALPIFSLVTLAKNITSTKENKTKEYLLILYQGLKPNRFYWEFVNIFRKFIILLCLLFSINIAIVLSLFVLVITGRLQIILRPYKDAANSRIEFIAIMAGVVTIITGLIYSQDNTYDKLNNFVLLVMVLINIKFILEWVYLLTKLYEKNSKISS